VAIEEGNQSPSTSEWRAALARRDRHHHRCGGAFREMRLRAYRRSLHL